MSTATATRPSRAKPVHVQVLPIDDVSPSPENNQLYHPIDLASDDMKALVASVREHGIKEPLVITLDDYILSGHRRHAAARAAGLETVPCRVEPIHRLVNLRMSGRGEVNPAFLVLLREHNRQREKTLDEKLREEVVTCDPEWAYRSLIDYRRAKAAVDVDALELPDEVKRRCDITKAKAPLLAAAKEVLRSLRKFWPLTVRQIHYQLQNDPPLIHASKPHSTYQNDKASYRAVDDILVRARLAGMVPWNAIGDETRPVTTWNVHRGVQSFLRKEVDGFLRGYWRDVQASQPNHLEIVGEKNTIASIIKPVAMENCIPMTLGRGYCSLPPRHDMAERFKKSGKEKLVVLILSDFDPDGEMIAESFSRSMRDDFGITSIVPIKVALTADQVKEHKLPPNPFMQAKTGSPHYLKFVEKYGEDVFELEALPAETMQQILRDAVDSVTDVEAFNAEVVKEKENAAELEDIRRKVHRVLMDQLGDHDEDQNGRP